jgi:hypothetical protein
MTSGKGLAAHLQVPLPYLLFRAQARYEEDLRGLQGVRAGISPLSPNFPTKPPDTAQSRPLIPRTPSDALAGTIRLRDLAKTPASPSTRGRVPSFSNTSLGGLRKITTSSTITLRGPHLARTVAALDPPSPVSPSDSDSDDDVHKAEEVEREQEAQIELARKLKSLEAAITADTLGLIRSSASRSGASSISGTSANGSGSGSGHINGSRDRSQRTRSLSGSSRQRLGQSLQMAPLSLNPPLRVGPHTPSSQSASVSSANSPQGSIPSIPSPPPESIGSSQGRPARSRRNTHSYASHHHQKSASPPAISPRNARGQMRYQALAGGTGVAEQESTHGSSASSFSDISGELYRDHLRPHKPTDVLELSISSSALESGVMSNIRGSRM